MSQIQVSEIVDLVSSGAAIVVDVREQDEIAQGMVQGAQWLPVSVLQAAAKVGAGRLAEVCSVIDKTKKVLLYCRSGNRSGGVADLLNKQGYRAVNLGGFLALQAAGFPTEIPGRKVRCLGHS